MSATAVTAGGPCDTEPGQRGVLRRLPCGHGRLQRGVVPSSLSRGPQGRVPAEDGDLDAGVVPAR